MGEEGVSTPSRRPQPIDESAASIAVITSEDIRRSGALTIPEVLMTVAGVDVMRLSESSAEVSIRGFNSYSSDKVLVMLDSRPLFNLADASVDWNLIPVSLEDIDRIELVRGPGSAMYGENAFLGIVNIITKAPDSDGGKASAGGGHGPAYKVRAGFDNGKVRASAESLELDRFSTTQTKVDNEFLEKSDSSPIAARTSVERGFFRTDLDTDAAQFRLAGGASRETTDFFPIENIDRAAYVSMDMFTKAGDIDLIASVRGGFRDQERKETDFPQGPFRDSLRADFELQGIYSPVLTDVLVFGAQVSYRQVRDEVYFSSDNERRSQTVLSAYFENQLFNKDKTVYLTTGARIDSYPEIGEVISPEAGLIFLPAAEHAIKLSWGQAFRSPALYELYGQDITTPPVVFLGNDALEPESISSWNLDYVYFRQGTGRFSIGLFYNELRDVIAFREIQVTPTTRFYRLYNENKGNSYGGQVEGRLQLGEHLELWANYCHTRAVFIEDGEEIDAPFSPRDKLHFGLNADYGPIEVSVWSSQVSDYIGVTQNTLLQNRINMNGYSTASARAEYRVTKKLSVEATFNDILGKGHYESPTYAPVMPYYFVSVNYGGR